MEISFAEFRKLDMKIGKVLKAERVPSAKNLVRMIVGFGNEKKQAVAGLLRWYTPEDLTGNKYAFILNIKPRKFMGWESQCMILAAEDDKGNVVCLKPEKDIVEGSRIC